jgi:carboxymethylenebutenolidase
MKASQCAVETSQGGTMPRKAELSANEQKLNDVFEEHLRSEFLAHSADQTMETMVANPRINEIPVMIGGDGREEVHEFYAKYFLPQIPPDAEIVPVSRTIGQQRLVDEMIFRFTHTVPMDWMPPGVAPPGKPVESRNRAVQW